MKDTKPMDDQIRAAAADWYVKRGGSQLSAEDVATFEQWLQADPRHRLAYEQCAHLWLMSAALDLNALKAPSAKVTALQTRRPPRRPIWMQVAAAVVLVATLVVIQPWRTDPAQYQTAVGEQQRVQLEDGSTLLLNTDTELEVKYDDHQRLVILHRGEAFFEVAKNPQRPFVVQARGSLVRAVGTAFNVALRPSDIAVAVTEGIVAVSTQGATEPRQIVELKRGQGLRYEPAQADAVPVNVNLEKVTAWQARKIYFDNQRLADAIADYNRYTLQKVVLVDKQLADQRISGVFNIGDSEALVFALKETFDARVVVKPHRILVLRSQGM